jgi:hypothetical protein
VPEPRSNRLHVEKEGVMKAKRIGSITFVAALTAVPLLAGAGTGSPGSRTGVDPINFTDPKPNPYFPLEPGTMSIYRGSEDNERLVERLTITDGTKMIEGVTTMVVRDIILANGHLAEKTTDWYAPDNDGNVWYFGEETATYDEQGHLIDTEGSWEAGVNGAIAGMIMPADPRPTDAYRQEISRAEAEDQAWIVQRHAKVRVPYGLIDQVVRTFEWTRLEPNVMSEKLYAPGLGIVREADVAGGTELLELVEIRSI